MNRKKELKEQYKQMKPDMGIFIVRFISDNKCYLESSKDLKSAMNRTKFQLNFGSHLNKELQSDWKDHGESSFAIEMLEQLEYDKDESKTDYSEELSVLKMIVEDKLLGNSMKFYHSK